MKKWLLISFLALCLGGLGFAYWKYYGGGSRPKSELDEALIDNYVQSASAKTEMDARELNYAKKSVTNLALSLADGGFFTTGYFPLTTLKERSGAKWSKENRTKNKERISQLVSAYGKIVNEASEVHQVPRILILGLMAVEHDDSVPVTKAASVVDSSGLFIGLMQTSVVTANDTLRRGVLNKQLSKKQVDFFKAKIGKSIDTISKTDLKNPEINIHAATAFLSVLTRDYGLDDLHKIIFSYNRGEFKLKKAGTSSLGIDELIKRYQSTADADGANYVIRALGVNGSFDILYNDLKITD